MSITAGDVRAALDVVRQLTDEIELMDAKAAIEMKDEIEALQKASKFCHELLITRTLNAMDGQPVVVGSKVYASKSKGKWRVDHKSIRAVVAERAMREAIHPQTGELVAKTAAQAAINMMYELFVSPADFPKQGGLKNLGLENKHVGTWERTGKELKVMELGPEVEDD